MGIDNSLYSFKQVRCMITRCQELRSTAEVVATGCEGISGRADNVHGTQDILCTLVDLDQATASLSRRQLMVVALIKAGGTYREIAKQLNVEEATIKFHFNSAISRIAAYLNLQ